MSPHGTTVWPPASTAASVTVDSARKGESASPSPSRRRSAPVARLASVEATALLDGANARSVLSGSNEPYVRARRALVVRLLAAGADPDAIRLLSEADDLG